MKKPQKMRRVIIKSLTVAAFASGIVLARGESVGEFKRSLAVPDSLSGSRVVINEEPGISRMLERSDASPDKKIKGYRISIFFDNGQDSREEAEAAMKAFRESFPDVPAYLAYENPYFRVTVGNCITHDEAIILMGKIRRKFGNTFIVQQDIPLPEFTKKPGEEIPADSIPAAEVPAPPAPM